MNRKQNRTSATRAAALCLATALTVGLLWSTATPSAAIAPLQSVLPTPEPTATPGPLVADAYVTLYGSVPGGTFELVVQPGQALRLNFNVGGYSYDGSFRPIDVDLTTTIPANTVADLSQSDAGWICPDGVEAGKQCTTPVSNAQFGASRTLVVVINDPVTTPDTAIQASGSIKLSDPTASDPNSFNDTASLVVPLILYKVAISNSARLAVDANANNSLDPEDEVEYAIAITNTSAYASEPLRIQNDFTNGAYFAVQILANSVESSAGTANVFQSSVQLELPPLAPGANAFLKFRAKLSPDAPTVSEITNIASVYRVSSFSFSLLASTDVVSVPVTARPELSLFAEATYNSGVGTGSPVAIMMSYANSGLRDASGVAITVSLPAGAQAVPEASTPGWVCTTAICVLNIGTLTSPAASGSAGTWFGNASLALTASPDAPNEGEMLSVGVTISEDGANGGDARLSNNTTAVSVRLGNRVPLSFTQQVAFEADANANGRLDVGDRVAVTLTLLNETTRTAKTISVADYHGLETVAGSAASSKGSVTELPYGVTAALGNIAPGERVTVTFVARVANAFSFDTISWTTVAAAYDIYNEPPTFAASPIAQSNAVTIPVEQPVRIDIQLFNNKSPNAEVVLGERVTYTVIITGAGSQTAPDIFLQDPWNFTTCLDWLPDSLITTKGSGTVSPQPFGPALNITLGSVEPGEVITASFAGIVPARSCNSDGTRTVSLQISAYSGSYPNTFLAPHLLRVSNAVVNPVPLPTDLALSIIDAPILARPGSVISFRLQYGLGNLYSAVAPNGIVITDVVPAHTTFNQQASLPNTWSCPDGSPAGTICTYVAGTLGSSVSSQLTFAVTVDANLPGISRTLNVARIADDGTRGPDLNPADNVLTTSVWFGASPVTVTHEAFIITGNGDVIPDQDEIVIFRTQVTNTSSFTLPGLVIDNFLSSWFYALNGTAVLTAPDGVFIGNNLPSMSCPTAFGIARACIDVPVSPGQVITTTFLAMRNSLPAPTDGSYVIGAGGIVYDEYLTRLAINLPVIFDGSTPPTPTPTPTAPPTNTPQPTMTGTPPPPTSTPQPSVTPTTSTKGRITIQLDAQPDSRQNFRFKGDLGSFRLDDANPDDGDQVRAARSFDVRPGRYKIEEDLPKDWLLANIVCTGPASVNVRKAQVTINIAAGQEITCSFINQRQATVNAFVWDDEDGNNQLDRDESALRDWRVTIFDGARSVRTVSTDRRGVARLGSLPPGDYRVCIAVRNGWTNTLPGLFDEAGRACYTINLTPGATTELWFGNREAGDARGNPNNRAPKLPPAYVQRRDVSSDDSGYDGDSGDDAQTANGNQP